MEPDCYHFCHNNDSNHLSRNCKFIAKCNVLGCSENHAKHYCKVCKNPNSNHFSSKCDKVCSSFNLKSSPVKNYQCKCFGCIKNHDKHYCKNCGDKDSNHFKKDCPKNKGEHCKVKKCSKSHFHHYCRFCKDKDSNHFAYDCDEVVELWHSTLIEHLEMNDGIKEIGLQPRNNANRFGKGIYFGEYKYIKQLHESKDREKAVLLKCKVFLGKCKNYGNETDFSGSWSADYDSCQAIHPPWKGCIKESFFEWVISNPKNCKVYDIVYKGKEFKFYQIYDDIEIFRKIKNGKI